MKTLPPVPRRGEPQESYLRDPDDDDDDNAAVPAAQQQAQQELVEEPAPVLLSPTVYKPPSPKTRPRANTATEVTAASIVRTGSSQRGIAINGGINVVNIPQRSNTTAGTMRSPKQQTSPPPRPSGSLSPKAKQCDEAVKRAKSEWI